MAYKRFLLFTYYWYYPGGGEGDVNGSYVSLDEAKEAAIEDESDFAEVLDMDAREFVWKKQITAR